MVFNEGGMGNLDPGSGHGVNCAIGASGWQVI